MTSQSSTTDIKRAGFAPLFKFTAKQFWTTILLFTIILFFILPVPVLMTISNRTIRTAQDLINLKEDFATDWVEAIRYFSIFTMSTFGIVTSCTRFKYLKNKVSIDFYHSLPVKRKQLFLTQLGVGALSLAIPYLFNIAFTLIIFMSNGVVSNLLLVNILTMSWEVLVYTLFTFSISTVVGMVSGLTAVQLTLTLVAIFVVPAITLMSILFISVFSENMWLEYYISPDLFEKLSPPLRLAINPEPLSFLESSLMLLLSAAMLVGAYAIYMKRKSERAGTPVVFTPLGEVIKYILVFLGTLCGGLLFYAMMEDYFWMIFGMACGMILVFMLVNTILHKTARAMFRGWRGLCVFGAVAAVGFIMLISNAFGINSNIPSPGFTSRVTVSFGQSIDNMEFTDDEVIKAISTIYKDGQWYFRTHDHKYEDTMRLSVVFYPKIGVPVAKSVTIVKDDFVDEFRTILDSEEFKEQYSSLFDRFAEVERGHMYLELPGHAFGKTTGKPITYNPKNTYWQFDEFSFSALEAKRLALSKISTANRDCGFDFFQQQNFGYLNMYDHSNYYYGQIIMPLFNSMSEVVDEYIHREYLSHTPEEYVQKLADAIDEIVVYNAENQAKLMTVTDKDKILEILTATTNLGTHYTSPFTFTDRTYRAEYTLIVADNENAYKYDTNDPYAEDVYKYSYSYEINFLLGKVPDFIIEHSE